MSDNKNDKRLSSVAKEFGVGTSSLLDFLVKKVDGFKRDPNAKISGEHYELIAKEFADSKQLKKEASAVTIGKSPVGNVTIDAKKNNKAGDAEDEERELLVKSNTDPIKSVKIKDNTANKEHETIKGGLQGTKVLGTIDLNAKNKTIQAVGSEPKKSQPITPALEKTSSDNDVITKVVEPVVKGTTVTPVQPEVKENLATASDEDTKIAASKDAANKVKTETSVTKKDTPSVKSTTPDHPQNNASKPLQKDNKSNFTRTDDKNKSNASKENHANKPFAQDNKQTYKNHQGGFTQKPLAESLQQKNNETAKKDAPQSVPVQKPKDTLTPIDTVAKGDLPESHEDEETIKAKAGQLQGLRILGKIDIVDPKAAAKKKKKKKKTLRPVASSDSLPNNKDNSGGNSQNFNRGNNNDRSGDNRSGGEPNKRFQFPTQGQGQTPATNTTSTSYSASAAEADKNRKKKKKKKGDDGVSLADNISDASLKSLEQSKGDNKPKFVGTPFVNTAGGHRPITGTGNDRRVSNDRRGGTGGKGHKPGGQNFSDRDVQQQVKATLAKMSGSSGAGNRKNFKKEKRHAFERARNEEIIKAAEDAKLLKVSEFITANELANLMEVSISALIAKCLQMGLMVSINQRLEADNIMLIADEFGFEAQFVSAEEEINKSLDFNENDPPESLQERAPIVTIMGHVDHGKTTLLDHIRKANVAGGEAGGITQHIGAYSVQTSSGKSITFLDTPGHEAFTAMRARGAKVTDIVIIVVAADDGVMPQTKEAINHALVAGVPIVVAINKMDKPNANPEKIRQELADLNVLVEEWGGKYQCQEISAKKGLNVDLLLEKVLIQAEFLDLKANASKAANGAVIEASLDKGRGYVTTVLVQSGTLKVGDIMLAGAHFARVRAMFDHTGKNIKTAGPCTPVQILGLSGAPQAGDRFNVLSTEREAREIATKREQIIREQSVRATRRLTLNDIGRRKALGNFHQLKLIVKGDVDGSVEALADSLLKLSNEEVEVQIIHKAMGQISESDVLLASASDAILIGFQVRPSRQARVLADREKIEIRLYSVIFQTIDEIKAAIEGLLAPKMEEVITGNVVVREVFKISKIGTIAGCYVTDGSITRKSKVRLIRGGIVLFTGDVSSLKRFKEDASEVKHGFECGLSLHNFNDIEQDDELEVFESKEVKRTLN